MTEPLEPGAWPHVDFPHTEPLRWTWDDVQALLPGRAGRKSALKNPVRWSPLKGGLHAEQMAAELESQTEAHRPVRLRPSACHGKSGKDVVFPNVQTAAQWLRARAAGAA